MTKDVIANRVSVVLSLGAIILSSVALYRSSDSNRPTVQTSQPTSRLSGEVSQSNSAVSQQRGPAIDSGPATIKSRVLVKQQNVAASKSSSSENTEEHWHVTYRGTEEVINIGEPLDIEPNQFDDDLSEEVVQIGPDLQTDQD